MAALCLVASVLHRIVPFYRDTLKMEAATRLTPLDGLRGLLCFSVMYHHALRTRMFLTSGDWYAPLPGAWNLLGKSAVALFLCITGFLFWGQAISRDGNIPVFPFLRARLFRIGPLYLFTALCAICIARREIDWKLAKTYIQLLQMGLMGLRSWGDFYKLHVYLINAGVTWTLPFEWGFYIALPALAQTIRSRMAWRIILPVAGIWVINSLGQPPFVLLYFLSGILAAHLSRSPVIAQRLRTLPVSIAIAALLILLAIGASDAWGWYALFITTLLFIPIACGNSLFGLLNLPGMRLMGMVSYSVYLQHGIYLYEARPWLGQASLRTTDWYWLAIFGLSCLVLFGSSLTYRLIEWPGIALEKRWRTPSKPLVFEADLPQISSPGFAAPK
jgi:peptidoglycan/LPS O-acetylase OafA/YrhL